jgi:FkbM family methyltransferase
MAAFPLSIEEYEKLNPVVTLNHEAATLHYCTPNKLTAWRVKTLFSKEPHTLAWIAEFGADEIFVDIGANVGMYTIWAARTRGLKVFAFEPESQNYALLNRNILQNGLGEQVRAYCTGLGNETGYGDMYLSELRTGGSCHAVGERLNFKLEHFETELVQGCHFTTLDTLVAGGTVPAPNHIKIDVDGFEHKVIQGAAATLENPDVKSILVEVNTNLAEHRDLVAHLIDLGFSVSDEQVAAALNTEGVFEGVADHVFRR